MKDGISKSQVSLMAYVKEHSGINLIKTFKNYIYVIYIIYVNLY